VGINVDVSFIEHRSEALHIGILSIDKKFTAIDDEAAAGYAKI
jgi:hypothetical protein